jgi:hypothetical protein
MPRQAAFVSDRVHVTRRLRTLQATDLIVLGVVVGFVLPLASGLLRVRDPRTIMVLAIWWGCAAVKRLMAWRNGQACERQLLDNGRVRAGAGVIVLAGVAPWFVLPLVQQYYPDASLWDPISLPIWLRAAGAVLMLGGVIRPFLAAVRSGRPNTARVTMCPATVESVTPGMLLDGLGFGLLAASPLLGVLMGAWLALTRVNR